MDANSKILRPLTDYFTGTLSAHGESARGVDWNSPESQRARFVQISRIFTREGGFSVNDLGCGYGAYCDFLQERYRDVAYTGIDITESMLRAAEARLGGKPGMRFVRGSAPDREADYGIACGIFNLRLAVSDADWLAYIEATLDALHATSRLGFAFNCLTVYSDADRMRPDLYYADPGPLFARCKRRYARNVALLHDYDLYEFTMLVRKAW
jgi:SAM-dependent methyltransferase